MLNTHHRDGHRKTLQPGLLGAAGRIGVAIAGLALAMIPPGCDRAARGPSGLSAANETSRGTASAFDRLEQMAERELTQPVEAAKKLPPAPGVDAAAVAELPDGGVGPARATLDEALAAIAVPEPPPSAQHPAPDEEAAERALRLYVAGRSKLQGGDGKGALADLEAASKLDPGASEIWREMGEAQLALGRRSAAMTSFQQAVATGSASARVFTALGHESLRLRRPEAATGHLLRAWALRDERADPACRYLVAADLAEILLDRGYLNASAELLRQAANLPDPFTGATRFRPELSELYRRQSDMWRDAGDIACRLADYTGALQSYEEASRQPTLDLGALVARRVYASLRQGRPAAAALAVVGQIRENDGLVEDNQFALVRYLARSTDVGPTLAAAIREIEGTLPPGAAPTISSRLSRAEAAALSGDAARDLLRRHLAAFPEDDAAGRELLSTYQQSDARSRSREVVLLAESRPLFAERYAYWLVDGGRPSAPFIGALEQSSSPSALVLRAYILSFNGLADEARRTAMEARIEARWAGMVRLARVQLAAACGDWTTTRAELAQLAGAPDAEFRARALRVLQRDEEALTILAPIADASSGDASAVPTVLLAAELAGGAGRAKDAERWLKSLLEADPYNETAHEALIRLYLAGGPLADQNKLTGAVRSLREGVPSSRTLRYFNAQELLQRQLYREAETTFLALVEDDISNGSLLNDLVTAWERSISAGDQEAGRRAETWLRARLVERPESIFLAGGLARILATEGRGEEAVAVLSEQLATLPRPEIARLRESIIREVLKKPEEADAMARERLAEQPPGVETVLERAELLARNGDAAGAAAEITASLPSDVVLSQEQGAKLSVVCARAVTSLGADLGSPKAAGVRELLTIAIGRGAKLSPQLHEKRLALMAAQDPVDAAAMAEATALIARQYPSAADEAYLLAARTLLNAQKPEAAVRVLEGLAGRTPPPPPQLLLSWVDLTTRYGDQAAIDRMFEAFDRPGMLEPVVKAITDDPSKVPTDEAGMRAEFAYMVGTTLNSAGRDALAEAAYRRALSLRPDHPWVSNNLGYQLLEEDRELTEAERLLEAAYRALPDQASVIDSVGWLRYKQRVLDDEPGPDGAVVREGAITLLTRAANSESGRDNSVLQEHLGDALWAAGRRDEAVRRWTEALRQAGAEMDSLRRANRLSDRAEQRLSKQITQVQAKLAAAQRGGTPALPAPFNQ
ncbi:MAG: hypothetical protein IT436_06690 [Phycisphaerales bacterium]|nr:hypothetical protein [Phycisphaerales bacterium]